MTIDKSGTSHHTDWQDNLKTKLKTLLAAVLVAALHPVHVFIPLVRKGYFL